MPIQDMHDDEVVDYHDEELAAPTWAGRSTNTPFDSTKIGDEFEFYHRETVGGKFMKPSAGEVFNSSVDNVPIPANEKFTFGGLAGDVVTAADSAGTEYHWHQVYDMKSITRSGRARSLRPALANPKLATPKRR